MNNEKKKLLTDWLKTINIEDLIYYICMVDGKIQWCDDTYCFNCDFGHLKNKHDVNYETCIKQKLLWFGLMKEENYENK